MYNSEKLLGYSSKFSTAFSILLLKDKGNGKISKSYYGVKETEIHGAVVLVVISLSHQGLSNFSYSLPSTGCLLSVEDQDSVILLCLPFCTKNKIRSRHLKNY